MALFGRKKKTEESTEKAAGKARGNLAENTKTISEKKPVKSDVKSDIKADAKSGAKQVVPKISVGKHGYAFLLKRPRITEKASMKSESGNVYVFEVARNATKDTIRRAVRDVYSVVPKKVSIAQTPSKNVFSRGKKGVASGGKKAYVYLAKGEKIEVI